MRLVTHLVRSDLRQFRWLLLVWCLLVVADAAVTGIRPSLAADLRVYGNVGMIGGLLYSALQIGTLLIVPLIVQAHPAVGTDAFWMTRPFPPPAVFAAKALLLGALTVLLPCGARLALMLWIHVPAREALLVTLDTGISSTAWLAVLMAGAAVTLNLPRFALLCGGVVVSFVVLMTVMIMRLRIEESTEYVAMASLSSQPVVPPADDPTQGLLFLLCVVAAGLGLVAVQYRTRLRKVAVPAAAGGLALAAFAISYWPIPLLKVRSVLPDWASQAAALQLRAESPVIEMSPAMGSFGGGGGMRNASTRTIVSGIEPGWVPRLKLLNASLTFDDGATLSTVNRGYQSTPQIDGASDNPARSVARDVLGVEQVFVSAPADTDPATTLVVPAKSVKTTLPAHGRYRGHFALELTRWEPVAALPLRIGSVFQDGSYRFEIEQVDAGPGTALAVRARVWRATSSFDRKPLIAYAFYVRNAQHSRALEGRESEVFGDMGSFSFGLPFVLGSAGPSQFFLRAAVVSFPVASFGPRDQQIDWDPAWYAGAELVIIRVTEAGAVLRTLDIPDATVVEK